MRPHSNADQPALAAVHAVGVEKHQVSSASVKVAADQQVAWDAGQSKDGGSRGEMQCRAKGESEGNTRGVREREVGRQGARKGA